MTLYYLMSTSLKGISQVMLIENVISGLIILCAITIMDYRLGIVAFLSALIGTCVSLVGGADKEVVDQGLFGYNSVLIGLALSIFLTGDVKWVIALAGAAFAAIFTATIIYLLKNLEVPVLTFPYIILTWLFLLTSYHLQIFKLTKELIPQDLSHWEMDIGGRINIVQGLINGVGQVYFQDTLWAGGLILIGIFWANWKLGGYAILGTTIGWLTAYVLVPEHTLLNLGLYGYNAVLSIIAISAVFNSKHSCGWITGCIAAIISVPITAGIHTLVSPYGLPTLTMPFVLVSWIFIGARKVLPKI